MPQEMDMNKLREEAARRAREMQSRAHIPPIRRNPSREEPAPPREEPKAEPAPQHASQLSEQEDPGLLGAFFQDKERTIILALLLLLSGDDKNHELLFALMFLLL